MDMELLPSISASMGAMASLSGKLDALLDTELKDEIRKLGSRLLKLSKPQDPPHAAMIWMNEVRELSYDMVNCVDADADWIDKMSRIFKPRVKASNGRYDRYKLESVPSRAHVLSIPTVVGGRKSDLLVGLHAKGGALETLCNTLTDGDEQLKVLSVVGVGGIGKTTLAKQLWREHKPGGYFDCRAFVRTAKKPDMRRTLRSILAQVRPDQPPDANEVHDLIQDLTTYLGDKRYFLIIDDLWAASVWDVARRALPEGNGSRIVITTEIKDVALVCCSYQSKYIFNMEPLSDIHSEELFISRVFGSGEGKSRQLDGVSEEVIRRCAGLPLAIISISSVIASQGEANTVQHREQIQNNLATSTTPVEALKQVLNFCYNCLPCCLRTCLLYLSLYPENYIILKEDIVKQWVAEGFILVARGEDKMKVAANYFDKLVNMGLIQHIDVGYSNDVYYYAVHPMVHDLITSKSREENFMTVIDYCKRTVGFSNKVSRLSLQFGSATYATRPESFGLSQVRSLAFIGLKSCYASILEFKVLRVLILHMWADEPSNTGVDLEPTSELVLLRSLQVTCNDTVHLPDLMQGPKQLETLEINARVAAIPARIVHLRSWLHLRLGVGTEVPDLTATLKIVTTLNPPVSLDDSSSPPNSVKTMELLSPICRIPRWIGQLTNLCILKLVIGELESRDISNLQGLSLLAVLSLHVQRRTAEPIVFRTGALSALEYFEFRCAVLRLRFWKGTMPNLQRLKLGFKAHQRDGFLLVGVEHLVNVKQISGVIGLTAGAVESDFIAAESEFREAMGRHLNLSVEREELYVDAGKQHEIHPSTSGEQTESPNQEYQDVRGSAEKQHPIPEKHKLTSGEQTESPNQEYQDVHGSAEKQHPIPGKHTLTSGEQPDYQTEIKQHSSSDSQLIKRSGPTKLTIEGKGGIHKLDRVLVFDKVTSLEELTLKKCPPLQLKHLLMLTSLRKLIVRNSVGLVGPLGGGQSDVQWQLLVEEIFIADLSGNTGKELTELLPHLPKLSKLIIMNCKTMKKLVVGVDVQQTKSEAWGGEIIEAAAAVEEDAGVLQFPAHLCDSLLELKFDHCPYLVLVDPPTLVPGGGGGGLQALRSLQRLTIEWSPKFLSAFSFSRHLFPSSLQFLELWEVEGMGTLEPLSNLSSLVTLGLYRCGQDLKCDGLQSLLTTGDQLKELNVKGSPGFFAGWDPNPKQDLEDVQEGAEQQTQLVSFTLQKLCTDDVVGLLFAPICRFLSSSLTELKLYGDGDGCEGMDRFNKDQEDALELLSSLQELEFRSFNDLQQLPAGLRNLTSLKKLSVYSCPEVSSLPNDGLPKSLQELDVSWCDNQELKQQCRGLVGTIPKSKRGISCY